ncbi:hypothetical protein B0H13DRAFT_2345520 [Mycena leptocephala]|nr:hypothetical protein B0H13DRAFT_2345520 [Mycena leptocephala]
MLLLDAFIAHHITAKSTSPRTHCSPRAHAPCSHTLHARTLRHVVSLHQIFPDASILSRSSRCREHVRYLHLVPTHQVRSFPSLILPHIDSLNISSPPPYHGPSQTGPPIRTALRARSHNAYLAIRALPTPKTAYFATPSD